MIAITLKAKVLHEDAVEGLVVIEIPDSRDLTPQETEMLDRLFPDLESGVGRLLQKQALFNAIK